MPESIATPGNDRSSDLRVALVCMPFYLAMHPSIQIGLLHAIVQEAGFNVDSYHLNLHLAAKLSPDAYDALCDHRGHLTGEWLFSVAAFGEDACGDDEEFFRAFPREVLWIEKLGKTTAYLSELRHSILPQFIDECMTLVEWDKYDVIGFSSTFQQNVACLAIATRIKAKYPQVKIVFGGANMEDEMGPELIRAFSSIDYAVVGEGDRTFPELLRRLASGQTLEDLPGIVRRNGHGIVSTGQSPPLNDLNILPVPQYDEYFERAAHLGLRNDPQFSWAIPFESSRGCWWGQKHHCTFCGLNGLGMRFRAKHSGRVINELTQLARKHRINFFEATDNIMDLTYIKDFFSEIQQTRTDYTFFYEVKSNLTAEQIGMLHRGGVRWLQPGIESLSTHVLNLMRKGCTMLQNVLTMRWCRYYRMRTSWNLLWGFPGETVEDFEKELEVMKLISHLEPPSGCSRIWVERFSPYFSENGKFPVRNLRPEASYEFVYPPFVSLDKIAYFFDYEMDDTVAEEVHAPAREWVRIWRQRWTSPRPDSLTYRRTMDSLFVDDNRGPERCGSYAFYGPMALMYEACSESIRSVAQVSDVLTKSSENYSYSRDEVQNGLDEFCRLGLMLTEDGKYLSLAIPVNPNW
jgi:ribosomal peptide maturation radical SAM protein 1